MNSGSNEAGILVRVHNSVLVDGERKVLNTLVATLPRSVTPDHLTALGVVGAAMIMVGCIAANLHSAFFLFAVLGLGVNWFGDSLDGSLARYRGIERPRYGFFVDQFSDVLAHFLMLFGLGLSPIMRLDVALMALLGSLAIMFYGHLKLQFSRTWQVSHYGVGPTELRIIISAGLIWAVVMGGVPTIEAPVVGAISMFDAVGFLVFVGAMACIGIMFVSDRAKIAAIDPARDRVPAEVIVNPLTIKD
jgi:archaetidylinositol phosphate synthase